MKLNEINSYVPMELAFKYFSIFSSGSHLVYRSETILAILIGSYLGSIPESLMNICLRVEMEIAFQANDSNFLFFALAAILSSERNHFYYFGRGFPKQHSNEVRMNSAQGYKRSWRLKICLILALAAILFNGA